MTSPIAEGFEKEDDALVGKELQYYLNCNTCKELVGHLRKSPNDEILVDVVMGQMKMMCSGVIDPEIC